MSKFKLKAEYEGIILTRTNMALGQITFDANKIKEEHFEKYVKLGFGELFEEVSKPINIKDLPKFNEPVELGKAEKIELPSDIQPQATRVIKKK
jgi:hypothetical protein